MAGRVILHVILVGTPGGGPSSKPLVLLHPSQLSILGSYLYIDGSLFGPACAPMFN